jgi:hypothetical protein
VVSAHQCWPAIFKHHAWLTTRIERACKPDSPASVETTEVLLNQEHGPVNKVSFGSVGSICVTLASQFSHGELFQLCVLGFRCNQDRDIGVGVFPEGEKILIGGLGLNDITLHGIGSADLEMR